MATTTQPRDVIAERRSIDAAIEGKTICDIFEQTVREHPDEPALSWEADDGWRTLTWRDYRDRVERVALGLRDLGVGKGDFVAIMARNRPEHLIADLGAVHAGATPVSLYNTLAPEQIAYIAGHCEARVAIVEGREVMERWEKVKADLPALERVVLLEDARDFGDYEWVESWEDLVTRGEEALKRDPNAFGKARKQVTPDDPVTLIYTSGTTGPPKGVIITHRNELWTSESLNRTGDYAAGMKAVSYLPLAHALERLATHYLAMYKAAHVHFCPDVLRVFEVVPQVRPMAFAGVPRLWEKLQAGISAGLAAEQDERKRKIAIKAVDLGKRAAALERQGKPVPLGMKLQRALFEKLVYSKIRHKIGLDRCDIAVSGAAPISADTLDFFAGIGLPIYEGYGMTEDSAPATINTRDARRMGSVGKAMPGVEVKLGDDGEVLIRGGNVAAGYYKEPEKTAQTFDTDGWLHTGDIGEIDSDGFLKIVDRKKELIITAGGKNISPANLEGLLKTHPLVGQACAIGDQRPYVSALIVLDAELAPGWAAQNGVTFTDVASFSREPRVVAEIQKAVDEANQHVSNVERIKRFTILPTEWTVDSEELTPTLKLKRRVIHHKYTDEIDDLYARS
jgi:long-subunit acyl-CoA synthetase (AMP-forming)